MTDPTITPASDAEIADTFSRANRVTAIGSVRALKLIARIAALRAEVEGLKAERAVMMEKLAQAKKEQ